MPTTPNYGQNLSPGEIRRRIFAFTGTNPNSLEQPGQIPSVTFYEQDAIRLNAPLDDGATEKALARQREVNVIYTPGKQVQMRNPVTDAVVPGLVMTHDQIFAAIYSLARQAQAELDAAEAAAAQ